MVSESAVSPSDMPPPGPSHRPEIVCHMVTTLDGQLSPRSWGLPEDEVVRIYEETANRLDHGGWIVGRTTMSEYLPHKALRPGPCGGNHADHPAGADGRKLAICFDRLGHVHPDSDDLHGDHLVIVLSRKAPLSHVEALIAAGVSVFFAETGDGAIRDVLARIGAAFGVTRLLLEGGGTLNGSFLADDAIDQTSTLLMPVIDGLAERPSIYEHASDAAPLALRHLSTEVLAGGVLWLRHAALRP